jgi:hypothetical protein
MAFVAPRRLAQGIVFICLFAAESLVVDLYMLSVGLSVLVPITEPFSSLAFAGLGISLFLMRRRRYDLAEQHIRVQAEMEALRKMAPLFASVRSDLESQLGAIEGEIETLGAQRQADKATRTMGRALQRLTDLSRRLDRVMSAAAGDSSDAAEQRLVDHDAQLGTTILAAIGSMLALGALLMVRGQGPLPVFLFAAKTALDATLLAYLLITHQQPSRWRATWILALLILTAVSMASYNEVVLLHANRPFASLLGHKVIMLCLGVTAASRFGLSLVLVLLTAIDAVTVYFWLHLGDAQGHHLQLGAVGEPDLPLAGAELVAPARAASRGLAAPVARGDGGGGAASARRHVPDAARSLELALADAGPRRRSSGLAALAGEPGAHPRRRHRAGRPQPDADRARHHHADALVPPPRCLVLSRRALSSPSGEARRRDHEGTDGGVDGDPAPAPRSRRRADGSRRPHRSARRRSRAPHEQLSHQPGQLSFSQLVGDGHGHARGAEGADGG